MIDREPAREPIGSKIAEADQDAPPSERGEEEIAPPDRKKLKVLLPTGERTGSAVANDPPAGADDRSAGAVEAPLGPPKIAWAREISTPTWATEETDIWVMNADGSNQVRLTATAVREHWPSWSPDGRHIAYVRISEIGEQDIWIMDSDGANQRDLGLCPSTADCGKLAWAPDGRRVAYTQGRDLYVADLLTGSRQRLVSGMLVTGSPPEGFMGETPGPGPTWSPDGRSLAFTCGGSLCLVPSNGGEPRVAAQGQGSDFFEPEWSQTGPWIAFGSSSSGSVWNIFVQRPDGTARRQLTHSTRGGMFYPTWASDGEALVYADWSGSNRGELWRIDFDGSDRVRLNSGGSHYTPDWWGPSE